MHMAVRSCDDRRSERYLAAYAWRFNRRFDLPKNVARLARAGAGARPRPRWTIAAVQTPAAMSGKSGYFLHRPRGRKARR